MRKFVTVPAALLTGLALIGCGSRFDYKSTPVAGR
jgi:hypothetical protein